MTAPRIVVFGRSGQVGSELARAALPAGAALSSIARSEVDLTAPAAEIAAALDRHANGGSAIVVNAAAYTAVDRAESDVDTCFSVNCRGAESIANACAARGFPLIHLSTDYVFDGRKPQPYVESDEPHPQNAYGRSKLAGEEAVRQATPAHVILRTAWVFSPYGTNFVKTMLRLGRERTELGIVDDQRGSPTAARQIAAAIIAIASSLAGDRSDGYGTFHYCGAGSCSWFEFAGAIFEAAARHGFTAPHLRAITTDAYPTPAARPANSVLDCSKLRDIYNIAPHPWRDAVVDCVDELLGPRGEA